MQGILSSVARHKASFYYDFQGRRESSFIETQSSCASTENGGRGSTSAGVEFYGSATPL
jgi:hypothetical protein